MDRCDFSRRICVFGLRSAIVENYLLISDLVCDPEQGLREGGHDHLRVGFDDPEVSHSKQSKQSLHCVKALFDAKVLLGVSLLKRFCDWRGGQPRTALCKIPPQCLPLKSA